MQKSLLFDRNFIGLVFDVFYAYLGFDEYWVRFNFVVCGFQWLKTNSECCFF